MTFKEQLIILGACKDSINWSGDRTFEEAIKDCERGDWLLWLHRKMFPRSIKNRTLAKAHCALTVKHLMKDPRSINACEVAIKYGEGNATNEELKAADAAAYAAAYAAYADAAAYAAAYAAYADAADAAAYAAYADAADAAAYAAYAADAADAADATAYAAYTVAIAARKANQKITADICKKYLIWE